MNESRILAGLPVFRAVATLGSFSIAAGRLGAFWREMYGACR